MKHTLQELRQWQALPLSIKERMVQQRVRDWVNYYGLDGSYISFSGGKDSTVLLDIARKIYPELKAMFVDVPTQYPELKEFVKTFDNVDIIKPKISFMEVCDKYGFPLISKEVSQVVWEIKSAIKRGSEPPKYRTDRLNGNLVDKKTGKLSGYNIPQYKFLLDADFSISHKCCYIMKKRPAAMYEKETGRKPITAQMACESVLRTQKWLQEGCNAFDRERPVSNPMAFWTEQDVLRYIKLNNLPICSVYGDVVVDYDKEGQLEGQLRLDDVANCELFNMDNLPLKTTGCDRTGCMLCGFGCHLEKSPNRFEQLKETHPGMYKLLDVVKNNGVTFREAIEWINEHGNLNIKL